ncbi:MAG: Fur family zinc uptake transcriptional regulator [Saprospiraceae bacterium]|jgi:Fur family zinc uptake transcriptional regulator
MPSSTQPQTKPKAKDQLEVAQRICASNQARLTPIRQTAFELICIAKKPLSAYELLDQLKTQHHNAQPPTIYRALEFLIEQRLIHKLSTINAYYVCDCPGDPHPVLFLICKICNQAKEMVEPSLMKQLSQRIKASGYVEQYPLLEVMATCSTCNEIA